MGFFKKLFGKADLAAIEAAGLPIITPILVGNSDSYACFDAVTGGNVTHDDVIISVDK